MAEIEEIWKPVVGYEGYYEVSNLGRVRSIPRTVIYKNGKTQGNYVGQILKHDTANGKAGPYKSVRLCINNKPKRKSVHRLVAEAFIPNPFNKPNVNHIDCDPSNNIVSNLEWCTQKENIAHSIKLGNHPRGSKTGTSIVTEEQVLEIRNLRLTTNLTVQQLADMFGMKHGGVKQILLRKTWKHI